MKFLLTALYNLQQFTLNRIEGDEDTPGSTKALIKVRFDEHNSAFEYVRVVVTAVVN
jgi:hypothetical protein